MTLPEKFQALFDSMDQGGCRNGTHDFDDDFHTLLKQMVEYWKQGIYYDYSDDLVIKMMGKHNNVLMFTSKRPSDKLIYYSIDRDPYHIFQTRNQEYYLEDKFIKYAIDKDISIFGMIEKQSRAMKDYVISKDPNNIKYFYSITKSEVKKYYEIIYDIVAARKLFDKAIETDMTNIAVYLSLKWGFIVE